MAKNYDKIANNYDFLSRLVFNKAQIKAQVNQLLFIPKGSKIIIVGGGTGWILEEIAKIHASGLQITYVEASQKMTNLAKKRFWANNQVVFFVQAIETFKPLEVYDVVLTPFLFDNFRIESAKTAFQILHQALKINGLWFFTDFTLQHKKGKWWKKVLVKSMYLFFRTLRMIDSEELIELEEYFELEKYRIVADKLHFGDLITAKVLQKII